jgi:hypothetical protein
LRALPLPDGLTPPYVQWLGKPSYEVCLCCGFEFGNDDEPGTAEPVSFETYLKDWIEGGAIWFDSKAKPSNWSLSVQLAAAGIASPSVS